MSRDKDIILSIEGLKVEFATYGGVVKAVRGVDYKVRRGKTLGVVGESGCGKSVTIQSIMRLIPMPPGKITAGKALFNGQDLIALTEKESRELRGRDISMIFQDPMTTLNPTMPIGKQISEVLRLHKGMSRQEAWDEMISLLKKTHIPEAETRARQYPFEFSGGMLQRAIIAMGIACNPDILIADEPTTALDVTIQDQVLNLMKDLQKDQGMSMILVTHDLGVVARMAHDVVVMYAGQIVESADVDTLFYKSAHPYTIGLRKAMPVNKIMYDAKLEPIDGSPPDLFAPPEGCSYAPRCPHAMKVCHNKMPENYQVGECHFSRCWLQHESAPEVEEIYQIHYQEEGEE